MEESLPSSNFIKGKVEIIEFIDKDTDLFIHSNSDVYVKGCVTARCLYMASQSKLFIAGDLDSSVSVNENSELYIKGAANVYDLSVLSNSNVRIDGNVLIQTEEVEIGNNVNLLVKGNVTLCAKQTDLSASIRIDNNCHVQIKGNLTGSHAKLLGSLFIGCRSQLIVNGSVDIKNRVYTGENSSLIVNRLMNFYGSLCMQRNSNINVGESIAANLIGDMKLDEDCSLVVGRNIILEGRGCIILGANNSLTVPGDLLCRSDMCFGISSVVTAGSIRVVGKVRAEINSRIEAKIIDFENTCTLDSGLRVISTDIFIHDMCVFGMNTSITCDSLKFTNPTKEVTIGTNSTILIKGLLKASSDFRVNSGVVLKAKEFRGGFVLVSNNCELDILTNVKTTHGFFVFDDCTVSIGNNLSVKTLGVGFRSVVHVDGNVLTNGSIYLHPFCKLLVKTRVTCVDINIGLMASIIVLGSVELKDIYINNSNVCFYKCLSADMVYLNVNSVAVIGESLFTKNIIINNRQDHPPTHRLMKLINELDIVLGKKSKPITDGNTSYRLIINNDAYVSNKLDIYPRTVAINGDLYMTNETQVTKEIIKVNGNIFQDTPQTIQDQIDSRVS